MSEGNFGVGPRIEPGLEIKILDKVMGRPPVAGYLPIGRSPSFQWGCILRRVAEWMYAQDSNIQYADYVMVQVDLNYDIFVKVTKNHPKGR